jgi:hypothetical protein
LLACHLPTPLRGWCYLATLMTCVTNVRLLPFPTFPVTSQHPTVGKISAVAWNPVSPYPSGIEARKGGAGASIRVRFRSPKQSP